MSFPVTPQGHHLPRVHTLPGPVPHCSLSPLTTIPSYLSTKRSCDPQTLRNCQSLMIAIASPSSPHPQCHTGPNMNLHRLPRSRAHRSLTLTRHPGHRVTMTESGRCYASDGLTVSRRKLRQRRPSDTSWLGKSPMTCWLLPFGNSRRLYGFMRPLLMRPPKPNELWPSWAGQRCSPMQHFLSRARGKIPTHLLPLPLAQNSSASLRMPRSNGHLRLLTRTSTAHPFMNGVK